MALNNITFVKGKGGLGRPLAGKDYISGLVFYTATLPSGFSSTNRYNQIFSTADAQALGIKGDYNDETQSTGIYSITTIGATGDKITLNFTEPEGVVKVLGSYVKTATETTNATVASALSLNINAQTYLHGYSASATGGTITITVRKGLGVFPNTGTPLTSVVSGTIAGSVTTAFSGGIASLQSVWYYHIAEFFRIQPKGFLWLSFQAIPSTYSYSDVQTFQEFTGGEMRQIGIFKDSAAYTAADTTAIQAICNLLDVEKMPISVVFAPNIAAVANVSTLADLAIYNNNKVSVVIGQDAGGLGNDIWHATGKSVTTLGATLGTIALSSVQQNIAWVGKFDLSNGTELESIAFANGVKFTDVSVTTTLLDAIDLKRYIFLRKFPNKAGSFFNDSHTAITPSSDYAFIENNRVIDKAIRGVETSLLPSLNSPLLLNANGTLANSTVAYLESEAIIITNQMVRDGEASAISVTIDPSQNAGSTSEIVVAINIVLIGVARNIIVNIGFNTSL